MDRGKSDLDVVKILGLTTIGRHGVYAFERREGQKFTVDVIMYLDTRRAARGDDLTQTVDYSEIASEVSAVLAGPPVSLIETLAQRIAQVVLMYEVVQIVEVVVHKPDAPIGLEFSDVSVTISRTRKTSSEPGLAMSAVGSLAMSGKAEPTVTRSAADAHSAGQVGREHQVSALPKRRGSVYDQLKADKSKNEVKVPRPARSAKHEAKPSPTNTRTPKVETTVAAEPRLTDSDSPLHAQMMNTAKRRAEREQWLATHRKQLEQDLENPACTPIARSMQDWQVGDPRPVSKSVKPSLPSLSSPLHATLMDSYVDHEGLTKTPAEPVTAIIALGANMGTPWKTLAEAVLMLDAMPDISVTGLSALFRSAPMLAPGQAAQTDYYNAVAQVRTALAPLDLLNATQMIENAFGRVRTEHWGPRTLDLDIITYGSLRSDDPKLILPHPRAHERAFVLVPWLQIDPNARVGRYGRADVLVPEIADQDIEQVATQWVEDAARDDAIFRATVLGVSVGREESSGRTSVLPQMRFRKKADVTRKPTGGRRNEVNQEDATPTDGQRYGHDAWVSSLEEEESAPKAKPRWMPLPPRAPSQGSATRPSLKQREAQAAPSASTPVAGQHQISDDRTQQMRSVNDRDIGLPHWDRIPEQRIIDEPDELHRADERQEDDASTRRPRLESGLAEDFASGLIPLSEEPVRPSRRTIVRPTVTGAIPIVKRGEENETS
ncbi:2-amino-4-hydroxy-6-hydroxymethyldihydropteridine diphosphokinase [Gleimia europaea ACS-120-V-Col10b]|uniref:Bifunctional folate synthesis protein n=2 Tax=Gleimia TaxID=2692113 RepID=A0A9W5VWQ1_9ACTO|nr:2-amino-4-hydroxy-6-hydroxymethyldihydropteridine diphosphokinase [Gleimia europaea ACS-120-V-Col10b]